jgi:hypothetical protein
MIYDNGLINQRTKTENSEPYSLYGDNAGDYTGGLAADCWQPSRWISGSCDCTIVVARPRVE